MNEQKQGVFNAIIAYGLWGVYPLYWRLLRSITPTELLINRMLWSFLTLLLFIFLLRLAKPLIKIIADIRQDKKKLLLLILATIFLSLNWFAFTFAMVSERILEASLGYYINPIINILIGVIFLKEKLNLYQLLAVLIAAAGVLFLTVTHGQLPWISLALAISFSLYGLVKKLIQMDAFFSLFLETTLMLPISVFFFAFWVVDGTSLWLEPTTSYVLLLIGAGFITMSPLYFFSKAAGQLPLRTLGFLQYIGPTIQVFVAVYITGEVFSTERFIAFIFIWIACLLFSLSYWLPSKEIKRNASG